MTAELSLDDLLAAYAAGRLDEPVALAVATHLALSTKSHARVAGYELLGSVLLEGLTPAPMQAAAWERVVSRLGEPEPLPHDRPHRPAARALPVPLRAYVPDGLDALRWRNFGSIAEAVLPLRSAIYRTSLVIVRAGRKVLRHTHAAHELVVVLRGGYSDPRGHYDEGDLTISDAHIEHEPHADTDEDCLCLAVTDGPLRFTGTLGRLINPFIRM